MFWVIAAAIAGLAALLLLRAALRKGATSTDGTDASLDVYAAQLEEIDGNRAAGLIGDEEAEDMATELRRRILRLGRRQGDAAPLGDGARRGLAIALAIGVPVAALGLYALMGSPDVPSAPGQGTMTAQEATVPAPEMASSGGSARPLDEATANLAARLKDQPKDAAGWVLLGRSYAALGNPDKALEAYREGAGHNPDSAELQLLLGEALLVRSGNQVTPEAAKAFEAASALDPEHPGPPYYLALAEFQAGRPQAAYDQWLALLRRSPPNGQWLPQLRQDIRLVAAQLGIDPPPEALETVQPQVPQNMPVVKQVAPSGMPTPSQQDVDTAMSMSAEDRAAFIEGMVQRLADRLAKAPDDLDGWMRLGNAYQVLGRNDDARAAYEKALVLAPANSPQQAEISARLAKGGGAN